jgi:two-component system, LuxR family, response regulator FixJ
MINDRRLVLIVDDDDRVRRALARTTRAAGYEVLTFARVVPCLQYCRDHRPDCMVLDLHLPGESGLDLARTLEAGSRPVPIVFISADDDAPRQIRGVRDVVAILHKPFERGAFLEAVALALA